MSPRGRGVVRRHRRKAAPVREDRGAGALSLRGDGRSKRRPRRPAKVRKARDEVRARLADERREGFAAARVGAESERGEPLGDVPLGAPARSTTTGLRIAAARARSRGRAGSRMAST